MNETVVAKSYMNHEKPQSSKSITRRGRRRPAGSRGGCRRARGRTALGPGRSASSRRRTVASSRPSSVELLARPCPGRPATGPSGRVAQRGVVVPARSARTRSAASTPRAWPCIAPRRAPECGSRAAGRPASGSGMSPASHSNITTFRVAQLVGLDLAHAPRRPPRAPRGPSRPAVLAQRIDPVSSDSISARCGTPGRCTRSANAPPRGAPRRGRCNSPRR